MSVSTSEVAAQLGITPRQVRRAAATGRIVVSKAGAAHAFSQRQVQAFGRMSHRGRDWSLTAQQAALDLLTDGKTTELGGTERSRLKQRIRDMEVGALAGQILRGRVSLRRAASESAKQNLQASLANELKLSSRGGLGVLVARNANGAARRARLGLDDSGDIVVVEGGEACRKVLEALVLYVYGDARESSAAAAWISSRQKAV